MTGTTGPNLVCTFGLEEGRALPLKTKPIADALRLGWALLFGSNCRVDGTFVDDTIDIQWPTAFGSSWPADPIFPFLPTGDVDVGWWPPGVASFGCDDLVAHAIHDKAFGAMSARSLANQTLGEFDPNLCVILGPEDCTPDVVATAIENWPEWAKQSWTLKPRIGTSGRGRVRGDLGGPSAPRVANGLARLKASAGAVLEPWCARVDDYSTHAFISPDGHIEPLGVLRQWTTTPGVCIGLEGRWTGRHRSPLSDQARGMTGINVDTAGDLEHQLAQIAMKVGERARAKEYSGLIGIDAFTYRDPSPREPAPRDPMVDAVRLRPVVEVNARFTMGSIAIGIAARAADAGLLDVGDTFSLSLTQRALANADVCFVLGATIDDDTAQVSPSQLANESDRAAAPGLTLSIRKAATRVKCSQPALRGGCR